MCWTLSFMARVWGLGGGGVRRVVGDEGVAPLCLSLFYLNSLPCGPDGFSCLLDLER